MGSDFIVLIVKIKKLNLRERNGLPEGKLLTGLEQDIKPSFSDCRVVLLLITSLHCWGTKEKALANVAPESNGQLAIGATDIG